MIILTSNGLSNENLLNVVKKEVRKRQLNKAFIIVTADNEYKHNNWHVERLKNELLTCGLNIQLFDLDTDSVTLLKEADVVEFIGGNPFYLLDRLRKYKMQSILHNLHLNNKIIIGMSAGSFVLQNNLNLVNEYSNEMNFLNLMDLNAMALVNIEVLPHYSKYMKRFENFEERCLLYEKNNNIKVIRLNDGDGILYETDSYTVIYG